MMAQCEIFEKCKVLTMYRSIYVASSSSSSSLHLLLENIGWRLFFILNSHWFCYLDSFVWWRVCIHNIWIVRIESNVFLVDKEREIFIFHWFIEMCTQFDALNRFFRRKTNCVYVQNTIYCIFANEMTYSFRRRMSANTYSYVQNTRSRVNAYVRQWYVNVFIICALYLYRFLNEIHRNDIENFIFYSLCLTHSHVSLAPLVHYLFSSFLFLNS